MKNIELISKAKISQLAKLKQKKYRRQEGRVVLEGKRLFQQLLAYGVHPLESYHISQPKQDTITAETMYRISAQDLARICDSDSPPNMAGLFPTPIARQVSFQKAFYLDGISDPGNLGTIFRIAAALGIQQIYLSENTCEISNPKLIRASLGAVYQLPFWQISDSELSALAAQKYYLDMKGEISLKKWRAPAESCIYILGSEAHGVRQCVQDLADGSLRIDISSDMESLNVAIAAGILAWELF